MHHKIRDPHYPVTTILITVFTAIFLLALGLFFLYQQQQQIDKLKQQVAAPRAVVVNAPAAPTPTPAQQNPPAVAAPTLTQRKGIDLVVSEINVAGKYKITQLCRGTVMHDTSGGHDYCLGGIKLIASNGVATKTIVEEKQDYDLTTIPVLLSATLVPTDSQQKRILIEYAPTCDIADSCGVGMDTNFVTYVFNVGDLTFRAIKNFPGTGEAVWNKAGNKAIFIVTTCGGISCGMVPLKGYDLDLDTTKDVTKEVGANMGSENGGVSMWSNINWLDNDHFTALLSPSNGVVTTVKGVFVK